jgi:organic hydroperoxide reductase OsmC/OhrA
MTQVSSAFTANHSAPPAIEVTKGFSLAIRLYCDYEQVVDFRMPGVAVLGLDERPPLGHGWGPSPAQLLGSSLGACLGGALMHCLRGAKVDPVDLRTEVNGTFRNDTLGRPRLMSIAVRLIPVLATAEDMRALPSPERVAEQSMIADSLRPDIALSVAITPELRGEVRAPARDVVRLVKDAPHHLSGER